MTTITVSTPRGDFNARILPTDYSWQDAAKRAIKRAYGKAASPWGWTTENWEVNNRGETVRFHYKATVVGRAERYGSGYPVLCEARVTLAADHES